MYNFSFYNLTKIIFGKQTVSQIGSELRQYNIDSVLLLAGSGSIKQNGVYNDVVSSLNANGIKFYEHFGVIPNPTAEHARIGINIIKSNNLQAVLAIGGGSVIDEGKAISVGCFLEDVWQAYDKTTVPQKALPLFTILTLSGTGTESNKNSVLSNHALKQKVALYSDLTFPKVSIIDPTIQISLPWNQTANGGFDAMTHCMENYFTGTTQETTSSINEGLMRSIIKSLDMLQEMPNSYEWRANLAWAAVLALNGTGVAGMNGGDWATHKLQHPISALYPKVAHAEGLAVVFPAWIRYCYKANLPQFERWAKNVWDADSVEEGIEKMVAKLKKWGMPTKISELGIDKQDIPEMVDKCVKNNPVVGQVKQLAPEDIKAIYELAY